MVSGLKVLSAAETIKGGVATVFRELANASCEDFELHVLIPSQQFSEVASCSFSSVRFFDRRGRDVRSFFNFTKAFVNSILDLKPDVVHLHSTFAGLMGRIALLLLFPITRPKVVYTPHGWAFMIDCSAVKRKLYAWVERCLLPLSDKVICVSNYERNLAALYGLPLEKMVVIYNGVDCVTTASLSSPFDDKVFNLLFVGRLDRSKGYDIALDIVSRLPAEGYRLAVIGESVIDGVVCQKIDNVDYLGWIDSKELGRYFANADILIMPSRWEAFGLVAVEAQSFSLPVVASNRCALPEVIIDGKTGYLFDIENPGKAAELIVATPLSKWLEMRVAARESYLEKFTAEKMRSETLNIYFHFR